MRKLALTLYELVRARGALSRIQLGQLARRLSLAVCPTALHCPALTRADVRPRRLAARLRPPLIALARTVQAHIYPMVPAGSIRTLDLHFQAPPHQEPAELDGTIILQSYVGGPKANYQASVAVTGKVRPFGEVRFVPASKVAQMTRGCFFGTCNTTALGDVGLYGSGVRPLLERMRRARQDSVRGEAVQGDGSSVGVTLSNLKLDSARPGVATATVALDSAPGPGKYAGSVPLSPLVKDAPSLTVEARSRVWVVYAIALIFLGVLTSGYVTMQVGLKRRRLLLRRALEDIVGKYAARRQENFPNNDQGALIWEVDLDPQLSDNPNWNYYEEPKSASDIYTAIKWARNDADLDEVQGKVLDLLARVNIWLLALTQCRPLWELAVKQHEPSDDWAGTTVALDTALLLRKVHRPPTDDVAAALLDRVDMQAGWHRRFAEAWDQQQYLIAGGGQAAAEARQIDLIKVDAEAGRAATRTRDEQDELDGKLEVLTKKLNALLTGTQAAQDDATRLVGPETQAREQEVAAIQADLYTLRRYSESPDLALASLNVNRAVQPQPATGPQAPPVPGTGAPAAPAAPAPAGPAAPSERTGAPLLKRLKRWDGVLSLAILLVSSLLYVGTVYNDTWGKPSDLATAFGAGFLGHLAIKWALLPIFRSIRLRAAATPPAADEPAAVAAPAS
jgi:hypothetical protein